MEKEMVDLEKENAELKTLASGWESTSNNFEKCYRMEQEKTKRFQDLLYKVPYCLPKKYKCEHPYGQCDYDLCMHYEIINAKNEMIDQVTPIFNRKEQRIKELSNSSANRREEMQQEQIKELEKKIVKLEGFIHY